MGEKAISYKVWQQLIHLLNTYPFNTKSVRIFFKINQTFLFFPVDNRKTKFFADEKLKKLDRLCFALFVLLLLLYYIVFETFRSSKPLS